MRIRLSLIVGLCLAASQLTAVRAQDLPTTTEHGITITPDHLTTAIQQTQDFWVPVRKMLLTEQCTIGTLEQRREAVAFLKVINEELHLRLFERGEPEALDLLDYLGHRLRMFEVFRQIHATIGDEVIAASVIERWDYDIRRIHLLPPAEWAPKVDALLVRLTEEMRAANLDEAKVATASKLWTVQADVVNKMYSTGAGKFMLEREKVGFEIDVAVGDLLAYVSLAADWVQITHKAEAEIGREDFIKAYTTLKTYREQRATAAAASAINR